MEIQDILIDKLTQLKVFVRKNRSLIDRLEDFPPELIIKDLQLACDIDKGYYKDDDDNYFYIRGVDFDDDAELEIISENPDSILFINFTLVSEDSVVNHYMPMNVFAESFLNTKLKGSTKKEFEKMVTKVINKSKKPALSSINPQKCLRVFEDYYKLIEQCNI